MEKPNTTIKLTETDTKPYTDKHLIQHNAKTQFITKIETFIDDISNHSETEKSCNEKKDSIERVHNTILINGKRGMGKTSFILSMEHNINKNISSLGIIDPTMIESKEHIFLHIISLIKTKIENNKDNYNESCISDWKKSLRNLAGGLSVLDGIGSNHLHDTLWDSPELILEKGLSNSKQGYTLEKNFHKFIQESLKVLEKKAFFLILDDIDTSLDKGRDILETLRKYLTSKQLIIAILGDIDLYSTLVRQLQWEKMDPNNTLKEYEGQKNYLPQIEHLEEQYLTKVLKPENRIDLETLLALESNIEITNNEEKKPISLENFMEKLIKNIYLTDNNYSQYYKKILLLQSTRSIFQILQAYDNISNLKDSKISTYITRFKHTFYSTLKKKLSKYDLIEIPDKDDFINLLSIYILKNPIDRDNHFKLIPTFFNEDDNISTLHINSMANHLLEPKDYLSYFIKIGYTLERYRSLDIKDENEHQRFVEHIGVNDKSCSKIARKILTTFPIGTNTHTHNPIFFGNISVSTSQIESIKGAKNIALIYSRVRNPKGGNYGFFSFFNLLGLLADLSATTIKGENNFWAKQNLIREFYTYKEAISSEGKTTEQDYIEDFDITAGLKKQLIDWSEKNNIKQKLPLYILSKIWIRVVYTFIDIETRSQNKTKTYLELFELYTVGFLNAVYVEIALYKKQEVDIKNPSISAQYFYDKLKGYKKDDEEYTLFDYLCECPIFKSCTPDDNIKEIFPALEKIKTTEKKTTEKKTTEKKIDFKKLSRNEQKKAIKNILDWEKNATITTSNKLREKGYKNVSIKELLLEMKQQK